MKKVIVFILFLFLFDFAHALPQMGIGVNYGVVNNLKMWSVPVCETGNNLQMSYIFKPNEKYSLAAEIGYIADGNVFRNDGLLKLVETASYIRFKNSLYLRKIGGISPYFHVSPSLNGCNLWYKYNNNFYFYAANVLADIGAGVGCDIGFYNFEASLPIIIHPLYLRAKLPVIFSFGCKYYFEI